jgi:hypothetical protein
MAMLSSMSMFAQTQNLAPAAIAARAKAQNVREIPYESVPNLLKFPANLYLGEGIGVATNSKGHIFVYTRSQRSRLFEFDQKGNYVREIGEGLYGFVFDMMFSLQRNGCAVLRIRPGSPRSVGFHQSDRRIRGLPVVMKEVRCLVGLGRSVGISRADDQRPLRDRGEAKVLSCRQRACPHCEGTKDARVNRKEGIEEVLAGLLNVEIRWIESEALSPAGVVNALNAEDNEGLVRTRGMCPEAVNIPVAGSRLVIGDGNRQTGASRTDAG